MSAPYYQFVKSGEDRWTVHLIKDIDEAHVYELHARVFLDSVTDRYYIEKPVWKKDGNDWHKIDRPYLTVRAAFKAVTNPGAKE